MMCRAPARILRTVRGKHSRTLTVRSRPVIETMAPKRKSSAITDGAADADAAAPRRSSRRLKGADPLPADEKKPSKKTGSAAKKSSTASRTQAKPSSAAEKKDASSNGGTETQGTADREERRYWLMKAEPETRLENGHDVSFSIDDLASKTVPEPWDGIRNYVARNNLRAMKKGDLAFFYHSNCKEPGIVGTMEVAQEHSPDLTAHDPKAPYYDKSSKPSDPKWSVVHVVFRSKFASSITLKELREMGGPGKPLQNMQMLKQTRLSVSNVSQEEWDHLMSVAVEKDSVVGEE
ncbi:thymocyte nuclear protein 1 [Gaeumannomyces tritici R3-111a-1]|uniref:Thymocyte nuclear protein 1 n=1 Tax=Gaeumannomyces tritici (strain R3-111a-1) TaxID=644352 RepID=J3NWA9_GAET3|nr:thymocyte nuclear protein 1 [Gaeumannomyces tritici R3-111a-1]EJT75641.1 thymocyte nuclear protein 1 [Gaeumannomyces tritici R3-111a-1]